GRARTARPDNARRSEGVNESGVAERAAKTRPLCVANARHSPSYGCALRLDWPRFGSPLGHAGFIHTF
ncbi:hypothetical protein, partial [uncultured Pseudacidovorax sp.]|uniref:hypothetical protein n=1 Tax=uncultured Pseudacidovorax sp. TaxID=679313 RepID=UPI0025D354A0